MSGDSAVVLAGSASATRLVAALSDLAAVDPQFVLVGGLAVMARLAQAHRATEDLDTLVGGVSFTRAVAMLPTGSDKEGVLRVRDVKVDTIEVDTEASWEEIATLDEPIDRLFTGGHLWAMLTATPVRITAAGNSVVVPVAPVPALLATKLHAYSSTRRSPEKRPSDALDVLRLGRVLVQDHLRPGAPPVVAGAVRWALDSWRHDPETVLRRLRGMGTSAPFVTLAEIEALADLVASAFAD